MLILKSNGSASGYGARLVFFRSCFSAPCLISFASLPYLLRIWVLALILVLLSMSCFSASCTLANVSASCRSYIVFLPSLSASACYPVFVFNYLLPGILLLIFLSRLHSSIGALSFSSLYKKEKSAK